MTQSIVIQVGQCGNQIGSQFYELALREQSQLTVAPNDPYHPVYVAHKQGYLVEQVLNHILNVFPLFKNGNIIPAQQKDVSTECFFRKSKTEKGSGALKARAVLVDMEEGVLNSILKGPIGKIFDSKQTISDNSGSGNNWAVGNKFYGEKYRETILDLVRKEAEHCDFLQSFFLLFSTGGGTGSGLGSAITKLLSDEFQDIERFVLAVLPSQNDDVVTSPYNTVLALHRLTEFADCVFPIENEALLNISAKVEKANPSSSRFRRKVNSESPLTFSLGSGISSKCKPYDNMNNIVANLILNLTSHSRYHGSLNVDMSEISMNLVPFPRLHYIVTCLSPLYSLSDVYIPARRLDHMFSEAFSSNNHLITINNLNSIYLACAMLTRGQVRISDIQRNITKVQKTMKFAKWNQEGWKIGLCPVPPVGHPYSLLALKNTTAIKYNFENIRDNFLKLYRRKAHLHHFLEIDGMEIGDFQTSLSSLTNLIEEYDSISVKNESAVPNRISVLI